jgi:hypothetical protein
MKRRWLLSSLIVGFVWLTVSQITEFVYPGPASLPAVTMALNRASSGDDFIWRYVGDLVENQFSLQ